MKFLIQIVLTALAAWLFQGVFHFPWWTVAIAAFLAAGPQNLPAGRSFLAGFLAIFLLWAGMAFSIDLSNESSLANQVGQLFPGTPPAAGLVIVTGLIGGFVGGMGALTATVMTKAFGKQKQA